jgi:hypothetical protein
MCSSSWYSDLNVERSLDDFGMTNSEMQIGAIMLLRIPPDIVLVTSKVQLILEWFGKVLGNGELI